MVIDMKTRRPFRIDQHNDCELTDEARAAAFVDARFDEIFLAAIKIRAVAGTDMALRALHQVAEKVKSYGRME